jgi:nitrogen-specific signal transduction histidine kinase
MINSNYFNGSPNPIIIVNLAGELHFLNEVAQKVLQSQEYDQQEFANLLPADCVNIFYELSGS